MKIKYVIRTAALLGVTYAIITVPFIVFLVPDACAQQGAAATVAEETIQAATEKTGVGTAELSPVKQGYVTVDFKDADITNVLRILSLKSGVNIVAGPEVSGTVTLRLQNVPWQQALYVVLRTYGFVSERDGNIIRVTTRENIEAEPLKTRTFTLNYTTAEEAEEAVKEMLSERGKIRTVNRTNSLIVTDIANNVENIGRVIEKLDRITPQCYIDAKIVRTELGRTENMGIDWNVVGGLAAGAIRPTTFPFNSGAPWWGFLHHLYPESRQSQLGTEYRTGNREELNDGTWRAADSISPYAWPTPDGTSTGTNRIWTFGTLDFSQFSAVLQLLKTRTNTKVISNPRIVVLNHQEAEVQVGQDIPIPTYERNETTGSMEVTGYNFRQVGVVLKVTPHINYADQIMVELQPEISSFLGMLQFTQTLSAPQFQITIARTQILVDDGETIAIGGLITDNKSTTEDKVPILGDIPIIGKLFRSKRETAGDANNKTETIFFVTITIVDTAGQPVAETAKSERKAPKVITGDVDAVL